MVKPQELPKTVFLCSLALIAFAGNSILCRLALSDQSIDPAGFTMIRLVSGIAILWPLICLTQDKKKSTATGSWLSAFMLFVYALLFSYAYVSIDTATGALVLFGSVQLTLVLVNLFKGQSLSVGELFGFVLALSGFVYLVLPQLQEPSLLGFMMMSVAGIAWAIYTVGGQGSSNALRDTAFNFLRTTPFILLVLMATFNQLEMSLYGVSLAIASGAITSGLGYALWYAVLPHVSTTQAAVMQLLVPILAGIGGVLFASEHLSWRLVISGILVLGGIMLVMLAKRKAPSEHLSSE